jgi:hypothetical protein
MGDLTEAFGGVVTAIPVVCLFTGVFVKILMTITL